MGCCGGSDPVAAEEAKVNKQINNVVAEEQFNDSKVIKLLFLGAGESGKSTLLKQLKVVKGKGFSNEDRMTYKSAIYQNCISCAQVLIIASETFDVELDTRIRPETVLSQDYVMKLNPRSTVVDSAVAQHLMAVWKDGGIQNTYDQRSHFQLADCAKYFLDRVGEICKPNYTPDEQDLFRSRVATIGVVETEFIASDMLFKVYDVGGQRNERKKWIHCFDGVAAVLFVVSLSEYDQNLFEDNSVNRMTEALNLFGEICNSTWFLKTSMILFLNKSDLFADKIRKVDLKVLFPEYSGGLNYEAGCKFIKSKFMAKNFQPDKQIFTFITNATDTTIVRSVFEAVTEIIITKYLSQEGLV